MYISSVIRRQPRCNGFRSPSSSAPCNSSAGSRQLRRWRAVPPPDPRRAALGAVPAARLRLGRGRLAALLLPQVPGGRQISRRKQRAVRRIEAADGSALASRVRAVPMRHGRPIRSPADRDTVPMRRLRRAAVVRSPSVWRLPWCGRNPRRAVARAALHAASLAPILLLEPRTRAAVAPTAAAVTGKR